jgi:hypothetical protein
MNTRDFAEALRMAPVYVATFEVTRVPEWALRLGVHKGQRLFYYDSTLRDSYGSGLGLGASHVTFIGYELYKGAKP